MRLATLIVDRAAHLVICDETGFFRIADLNEVFGKHWPTTMDELLKTEQLADLNAWFMDAGQQALETHAPLSLNVPTVQYARLFDTPKKYGESA